MITGQNMIYRWGVKALVLMIATVFILPRIAGAEMKIEDIEVLNFGIISTESTQTLKREFEPFLKDMEKSIGLPVKAFFAGDYAGVIEAMRFSKVHVAWFGNNSAIEAVDRANGEVFAQMVDANGDPGYWSLIITHKDSGLDSLEDIIEKGKELNFGNGDVNSTSGYLIPSYYLWGKYGIDPKKYFKTARNASHGANIMAVAMKQVDFSTNNTEQLKDFTKSRPDLAENIKVLWKSPLIPKDPLVWRRDLPQELKSKIKAFVLGYGRTGLNEADVERQLIVLKGISGGLAPFLDSSNKQLIPIREIKLAKALQKIENDKYLKSDVKDKKIKDIQIEIAEVRKFGEYLDRY